LDFKKYIKDVNENRALQGVCFELGGKSTQQANDGENTSKPNPRVAGAGIAIVVHIHLMNMKNKFNLEN